LGSLALPRGSSPKSQPISTLPGASLLATAICLMRRCGIHPRTLTRPNMGIDTMRRHASAWFEWRSRGWLCSGLGFEYRTGNGSSTLSPDHCTALLRKSPQADIVRRTIITDDRRQRSSSGRPESRGQVRRGSEASRVHREGCGCGVELMRCDAGTWGGRTEFGLPANIVPPFVLLLGRQAVFTHVVIHFTCILLLKMTRGLRGPLSQA